MRDESEQSEAAEKAVAPRASMPWSLSNKLLLLTLLFVMLAEVLIYIPSIANFRNNWLSDKLETAALLVIAVNAGPGTSLSGDLAEKMLAASGIEAIGVKSAGRRWLLAAGNTPSEVAERQDVSVLRPLESIRMAFAALFSTTDRPIMVSGRPPPGSDGFEIVVQEANLRRAMLAYSANILLLSLVISVITAMLVYAALRFSIVRPMQRLSANIVAFAAAPEDTSSTIVPSGRSDEVGVAEARLAEMQRTLRELLGQRRHLADLGLAVSKINHDLRNILASAQLFSDRLGSVEDPLVKRFAPKVIRSIDRAIDYTRAVLAYGQAAEADPSRQLLSLRRLVDDVADVLALNTLEGVEWDNRVPAELEVDADAEQLFRLLMNLCRNALEAMRESDDPSIIRRLWVEGERQGSVTILLVCDTGPGVPRKARVNLFQPFQGSARSGGTGLGLPIAAEIVRAHGGEISLVQRPGAGAIFQVRIPDRPVDLGARRQARRP